MLHLGCPQMFWGRNCEIECSQNCINQQCYPGNGSCIWGCINKNCLGGICDKDTAVCTEGCKGKQTGPYCNICK